MKLFSEFKSLPKGDKVFWIANYTFSILTSILCIVLSFYYGFVYNWNNRLFSAIAMSFVCLIPILFELISQRRLPNIVFLTVNLYILFSGVLGSALNNYYLISWYDIVIHTIMGYAIAMLALFFICRLGDNKRMRAITIALFCLFFSLGIELIWEIFERFIDVFLGQTAQGVKVAGTNSPLVVDTIEDLICNFSGAMLFFIHFIVDRFTKLDLGFNYIIKDFSRGVRKSKQRVVVNNPGASIKNIDENKKNSDEIDKENSIQNTIDVIDENEFK